MSIADNLAALISAKNDISAAITAKGVDTGSHGFSHFADDIMQLPNQGYVDEDLFNSLSSSSFFENNDYCTALISSLEGGGHSRERAFLEAANSTFEYALAHSSLSLDYATWEAEWDDSLAPFPSDVWPGLEGLTIHIEGQYSVYGPNSEPVPYLVDEDIPFSGGNIQNYPIGDSSNFIFFNFVKYSTRSRMTTTGLEYTFVDGSDLNDLAITMRWNGQEAEELVDYHGTIDEVPPTVSTDMYFRFQSTIYGTTYVQYTGVGTYTFHLEQDSMEIVVDSESASITAGDFIYEEIAANRLTLEFVKKISS